MAVFTPLVMMVKDCTLLAHVDEEGGPLNRAPRASIIAEAWVLQALSIVLQENGTLRPKSMCFVIPVALWASCGNMRNKMKCLEGKRQ